MVNLRVSSLNRSSTLKITALTKKLRKEGKDVVNFAAGEPDFDTPAFIKEAARTAIDDGFTKYTPSTGSLELKQAIAAKLKEENALAVGTDQIIVTSGAKYALFIALLTCLSEQDEVILPSPYWVSYPEMVKLTGAKTKFLPTLREDGFKLKADLLSAAISSCSKLLILNYPANPTGATYSKQELLTLAELVKEKDLLVLSDEIYETLVYDGRPHTSLASLPGMQERTITVNGFSKAFSMTGWRLGYLVGPQEVITEATKIVDHTTSCACAISQKAGLAAFSDRQWVKEMAAKFEARRNLLFDGLKPLPRLTPLKPQGTFYIFCDISKTGLSSFDFCSQLLERELVSCIPANGFGAEGFIRISFAAGTPDIEKGIVRIKKFVTSL